MKKLPMIMIIAAPYLLMGRYFSGQVNLLAAGAKIYIRALFLGGVYAIFLPKLGFDGRQILFWCMMIKICCIPFFRLVFLVAAGLFIMIIPLLPFLLIFDYRLLLAGSAYGVRGLLSCRKEGRLSDRTAAANIVLQFLFCADVFSAVYCYIKATKSEK